MKVHCSECLNYAAVVVRLQKTHKNDYSFEQLCEKCLRANRERDDRSVSEMESTREKFNK